MNRETQLRAIIFSWSYFVYSKSVYITAHSYCFSASLFLIFSLPDASGLMSSELGLSVSADGLTLESSVEGSGYELSGLIDELIFKFEWL